MPFQHVGWGRKEVIYDAAGKIMAGARLVAGSDGRRRTAVDAEGRIIPGHQARSMHVDNQHTDDADERQRDGREKKADHDRHPFVAIEKECILVFFKNTEHHFIIFLPQRVEDERRGDSVRDAERCDDRAAEENGNNSSP